MPTRTRRFASSPRNEHEQFIDITASPAQAYYMGSTLILACIRNSKLPEQEKAEATKALADTLLQLEGTVLEGINNPEAPAQWEN